MSTKEEHLLRDVNSLKDAIKRLTKEKGFLVHDIDILWEQERTEREKVKSRILETIRVSDELSDSKADEILLLDEQKKLKLKELEILKSKIENHQLSLGVKRDAHSSLANNVEESEKEFARLQSEISSFTTELSSLSRRKSEGLKNLDLLTEKTSISNQEVSRLGRSIALLQSDEKKLQERVHSIESHRDVLVEDVLTERNELLKKRHVHLTGMNVSLDTIIEKKQIAARAPN